MPQRYEEKMKLPNISGDFLRTNQNDYLFELTKEN